MNVPYVKKVDDNGTVLNPITKSKPYLNYGLNRSQRRHPNKDTRFLQKEV
jgi:hypothetical protein